MKPAMSDWDMAELESSHGCMVTLDGAMDGTRIIVDGQRKIDVVLAVADMDDPEGAVVGLHMLPDVDRRELANVFLFLYREMMSDGELMR